MASSNKKKRLEKKRKKLYQRYGHLIGSKTEDIPEKHQAPRGGLRCFRKIYPRDEHGNKQRDKKKKRCKNVCAKGSLYCKKHGGANSRALTSGNRTSLDVYRGAYTKDLGNVLEIYLKDPDIMDHKRELATLRTILTEYIDRFSRNKPVRNHKKINNMIREVLDRDDFNSHEKFFLIKDIVDNEISLTDGNVVDRITRLTENIGKSIERIDRIERKSDFYLTPEGLKLLLRTMVELVNKHIPEENIQGKIRQGLMEASTKAGSGFDRPIDVKTKR